MARTIQADRIERTENTIALLLDIVSAVEVLALLIDDPVKLRKLDAILDLTLDLKTDAIHERNTKPAGKQL